MMWWGFCAKNLINGAERSCSGVDRMAYISVGDLTTYLFCPRKLYAKRRMGVVLSRSSAQDFGSAAHQLARRVISAEEVVVPQVRSSDSVVDIARRFHVVWNS